MSTKNWGDSRKWIYWALLGACCWLLGSLPATFSWAQEVHQAAPAPNPAAEPILEPEGSRGDQGTAETPTVGNLVDQGTAAAVAPPKSKSPEIVPLAEADLDPLALLKRKWFERQRLLEVADPEVADNLLPSLLSLRLDLGVDHLISYSHALIRESEKAERNQQQQRALSLAAIAKDLSPDYPPAYFYYGQLVLRTSPFSVGEYTQAFVKGWLASLTSPAEMLRHVSNVAIYFGLGILVCFLFSIFVLLYKYTPLFVHLLHHMLIVRVSESIGRWIVLALLFLPILLRLGIAWVILLWCLLLIPVARTAERVFLSVVVILIAVAPFFLQEIFAVVTPRSEPAYQVLMAMQNEIDAKSLERMRFLQERPNPSGIEAFALGYVYKKRAQYPLAKKYDEKAVTLNYATAAATNNLGNVHFALGDPTGAIEIYKKAQGLDPDLFQADYNLGRAYYEIKDSGRGTEALESAAKKNAKWVNEISETKSANFNRLIADVRIPLKEILTLLTADSTLRADLQSRILRSAMRPFNESQRQFFALGVGAVWLVVMMLSQVMRFPQLCTKCGDAACQWCYATAKRPDLCSQCFNLFVKKEGVDPLAREHKEVEISKREVMRHRLIRGLTFLAPGSGHLFLGRVMRGLFLQIIFVWLVCLVFFWEGAMVAPAVMGFFQGLAKGATLFIFGGLFYGLVVRNIFQE